MSTFRYSLNNLKNSFNAGNTSNWVVRFEKENTLNLIKDSSNLNVFPASEVSFNEFNLTESEITVGPGLKLSTPKLLINCPETISITFFEDNKYSITKFIKKWLKNIKKGNRNIRYGNVCKFSEIKNITKILTIYKFDEKQDAQETLSYYVYPLGLTFHGDQNFSLQSNSIEFKVVGTFEQ